MFPLKGRFPGSFYCKTRRVRAQPHALLPMKLRLQFPPTPEYAAKHAQLAVEAARNVDCITLDYTPQSLREIDRIVNGFHSAGLGVDHVGETVFAFGCYVGEVLVRREQGVWKMPADTALPAGTFDANSMMVVELPSGTVWNPLGKTFKLLENGLEDSLVYFYQIATIRNGGENPSSRKRSRMIKAISFANERKRFFFVVAALIGAVVAFAKIVLK